MYLCNQLFIYLFIHSFFQIFGESTMHRWPMLQWVTWPTEQRHVTQVGKPTSNRLTKSVRPSRPNLAVLRHCATPHSGTAAPTSDTRLIISATQCTYGTAPSCGTVTVFCPGRLRCTAPVCGTALWCGTDSSIGARTPAGGLANYSFDRL